jgi:DNA-binding transcriptional LysR family regulator
MRDLNDYALFAAVVQHGGFSAAARVLRVPKSRLSKHVNALEKRLGVRLIERSTRRFQVTDLGREFYRQCEAIISGAEAAEAVVAQAKAEPHGLLRVACPPGIADHILAEALPSFMTAHPRLRLQILVSNRRVDLIEERVDVAFRVRTKLDTDTSLTMRVLDKSRAVLTASPGFAAAHRDRLTIAALGSLPTLSHSETAERDSWRLTREDGSVAEIVHEPVLGCSNFNVLTEAAVAGLGVALLPDEHCSALIRSGMLVQVLPEWTASDGIVHLVFTSKRGLLPAARAFIDHVVQEFPKAVSKCRARAA